MFTIEKNINQFFKKIQQESFSKTSDKQISFILDLFFIHVFLESFFFTNNSKFIRCQGIHAFKNKKHIPTFLKKEYLRRKGYSSFEEEYFEIETNPLTHSQTVQIELFDNIPVIQDIKETLEIIHNRKQQYLTSWVPVISKSKVKNLKRKLNNSFVLSSWDSCHDEFVRTMKHTDDYDYYSYCNMTTHIPSIYQVIDFLNTIPLEQIKISLQFLNHFGEFNPKKIFGIDNLEITKDDINNSFPQRTLNVYRYDIIDGNDFPCKCKSEKKCQKSSHSYLFIKELITERNLFISIY